MGKVDARTVARMRENYPTVSELQRRALRNCGLGMNASPKEIEDAFYKCLDQGKEETAKVLLSFF